MIADYSAYLTPERLAVEEQAWRESGIHRLYATELLKAMASEDCISVVEVGCGTGWVPTCLPDSIMYGGVDVNAGCIEIAQRKNPFRDFLVADIRESLATLDPSGRWWDAGCAFAFLKHFALHEWSDIVRHLLSFGRVGVFTMNVGTEDVDDFSQGYPHTWVTPATLDNAVQAAGHGVVSMTLIHTGETMVRTRAT